MSYELLTDDEFVHELDVFKTMTDRLRGQAEKLVTLKTEGRVSDQVYSEVLNEISQRYDILVEKFNELNKASEDKNLKSKEELKNLRYQLESFEVRYAVGSMPEDQYKMMRAGLLLRIQEIEELTGKVTALIAGTMENIGKIESIVGKRKRLAVAQPVTQAPSQPTKAQETRPSEGAQTSSAAEAPATGKEKAPKKEVKNCRRCGAENPENAIYCYNCGAKL